MTRITTLELLDRLVSIDSTSSRSNHAIADFVCDYLDRPGISIERRPTEDGKVNLVVVVGGDTSDARDGLVLSGHLDTVPADESGWRTNPFRLTPVGNDLHGRGTADMKGFLAVVLNLIAKTPRVDFPIVLLLTCDEEIGCLGSKHLVESWPSERLLPRAAVIGEPTSLRVVGMHKGHTRVKVSVLGKSAHSGYPHLGSNAIEKAGSVVSQLALLRKVLESERYGTSPLFPEVPFVPLNIGMIAGGRAINVVPDECAIEVGFRIMPRMTSDAITDRIRAAVGRVLSPNDVRIEIVSDSPPMIVESDAEISRAACELRGQGGPESVCFATDAGWLRNLDLDCILLGPGSIEVAHKPNESVPIADLKATVRIVDRLIDRFCRRREDP